MQPHSVRSLRKLPHASTKRKSSAFLPGCGVACRTALLAHLLAIAVLVAGATAAGAAWAQPASASSDPSEKPPVLLCTKADGYRGIWYSNQPQQDEYVYKYSGGLGTYCAKHRPFAVYAPEANKTFFCYGGTLPEKNQLVHMVSYYDHASGMVPRPTLLLDKQTDDAHDNPVIAIDGRGHVWIFSSSHGTSRPSYVSVSSKPYSIDSFELVQTTNFSYPQVYWTAEHGFLFLHTRYLKNHRRLFFVGSADGRTWSEPQLLAYIDEGHYAISSICGNRLGVAFNYHPAPEGLNWRTNLYYMETVDGGRTWRNAQGELLQLPLTTPDNPALVHDYRSEKRNVYLKDVAFDGQGRPVILYLTSGGWQSGPVNDPRIWTTARWTGNQWEIAGQIRSDNNYDTGSLYLEPDGTWRLIAPTESGPQPFNTGGEVAMWTSRDQGRSWTRVKQLTQQSPLNHTYCRRPLAAHDDFYALWADGHGRKPSASRLYFCDKQGNVYLLPPQMDGDFARPQLLPGGIPPQVGSSTAPGSATERTAVFSGQAAACGVVQQATASLLEKTYSALPPASARFPARFASCASGEPDGANRPAADDRLPEEYLDKLDLLPDICQTDEAFHSLPDRGRFMCGPTSMANVLVAMDGAGFDRLVPGDVTLKSVQRNLLAELVDEPYMKLSAKGIGPLRIMEGMERFLAQRGYQAEICWCGWRYGGKYASADRVDVDWLCRGTIGPSNVVLNVGWYRHEEDGDRYVRLGGHYMVLAGYRRQQDGHVLLIHDPSSRSGPGKVTHQARLVPLQSGTVAVSERPYLLDTKSLFRIEGVVIKPSADLALLDGAIQVRLIEPVEADAN